MSQLVAPKWGVLCLYDLIPPSTILPGVSLAILK